MIIEAPFDPDMINNENVTTCTCKKMFDLLSCSDDEESLKLGKFSINLLKNLIYSGISIDSVKKMKEILKCFNEEKYSDIPLNQELNRVGLNYSSYFISK